MVSTRVRCKEEQRGTSLRSPGNHTIIIGIRPERPSSSVRPQPESCPWGGDLGPRAVSLLLQSRGGRSGRSSGAAIAAVLDLSWVYGELAPYCSCFGRPSLDPALMIRMLIVGYVFAIRSERTLCRDVRVNLAYRWFCGLSLEDQIPDHSAFSRAPVMLVSTGFRFALGDRIAHHLLRCIRARLTRFDR